jgi:hypothetical protein
MRTAAALLLSVALATATSTARAADPAAAQTLFDEAKRLMSQRRFAEARDKFAESQRLDPGIGTLFHLADCEERMGLLATAWATYLEVAAEAKTSGEAPRETAARERATALNPRVPHLTIEPGSERSTPGLQIMRDGSIIGPAQWNVAVPLDPGPHTVDVTAPGKGSWHTSIDLRSSAAIVTTVPLLADMPTPPAVASRPGPPTSVTQTTSAEVPIGASRGTGQRVGGALVGVAGLVGLGVGTYYGVTSLQDHNNAQPHCGPAGCDATGVSLRNDARQAGTVSTIALIGGGAALLVGIVVYATAPHSSATTSVAVGPGGVIAWGTF